MTANEFLAGWLSDMSIATGVATMAAIAYKGIFEPFKNKEQRKIAGIVVAVAAIVTVLFFAGGLALTEKDVTAAATTGQPTG